jgi:hypothetical protein
MYLGLSEKRLEGKKEGKISSFIFILQFEKSRKIVF